MIADGVTRIVQPSHVRGNASPKRLVKAPMIYIINDISPCLIFPQTILREMESNIQIVARQTESKGDGIYIPIQMSCACVRERHVAYERVFFTPSRSSPPR